MIFRITITFLMFVLIVIPCIIVSLFAVPIMLQTKWDGRSTLFGNAKWGRGNNHMDHATKGFWQEFNWLVLRNPVNNLHSFTLAVENKIPVIYTGPSEDIGDKLRGGFYAIRAGKAWEYYWIRPYWVLGSHRCIRARIGWKIYKDDDALAAFVFAINPFKKYLGV